MGIVALCALPPLVRVTEQQRSRDDARDNDEQPACDDRPEPFEQSDESVRGGERPAAPTRAADSAAHHDHCQGGSQEGLRREPELEKTPCLNAPHQGSSSTTTLALPPRGRIRVAADPDRSNHRIPSPPRRAWHRIRRRSGAVTHVRCTDSDRDSHRYEQGWVASWLAYPFRHPLRQAALTLGQLTCELLRWTADQDDRSSCRPPSE